MAGATVLTVALAATLGGVGPVLGDDGAFSGLPLRSMRTSAGILRIGISIAQFAGTSGGAGGAEPRLATPAAQPKATVQMSTDNASVSQGARRPGHGRGSSANI